MPFDLQIIRAAEFVRVDAHNHLDFEASREALQTLASACRKRGLDRALLDLRALPIPPKPLFTPRELVALIETFREAGFGARQRLAILYRSDPHRGTRMFAFISRLRGWQVRAFPEFEEAVLWLSQQGQAQRRIPEGQHLPIKFALPAPAAKAPPPRRAAHRLT
jgi:hypothetical protein